MEPSFVKLTTATNPYQRSVIEEILQSAGIPYARYDGPAPTVYIASASPLAFEEFRVPPERLQEAKDTLCAHGIVCEASEPLLSRAIEEIIRPLLSAAPERAEPEAGAPEGADHPGMKRLQRFVRVNNRETVRALFDAVLAEGGGRDLLEALFFQLAREGSASLNLLARSLRNGMNAAFVDRFQSEATLGAKKTRLALLGVLAEIPKNRTLVLTLAAGLRDRDGEIREAASEALFALNLRDFGYDPSDPPGERESAVQRLLAETERA